MTAQYEERCLSEMHALKVKQSLLFGQMGFPRMNGVQLCFCTILHSNTVQRLLIIMNNKSHLFNMGTVLYSKTEIVLHGFDLGLFVPQGTLETLLLVTTRGATGTDWGEARNSIPLCPANTPLVQNVNNAKDQKP